MQVDLASGTLLLGDVLILPLTSSPEGRRGLMVKGSDSGARGRGFDPHSGHRVVSLSKAHLLPKNTSNTQEAVAPSQHD